MKVTYLGVILENPDFAKEFLFPHPSNPDHLFEVTVPGGVTEGVRPEIYGAYRVGLDSACADMVIATRLEDGTPAVLLSKRSPGVCYGNKWWIHGGATHAYRPIATFLRDRAERECGVRQAPDALIGVYRTMSEDFIGSTTQSCFATKVSVELIRAHMKTDGAHRQVRLFGLSDLELIPEEERHWYPMRVSRIVLSALMTREITP